MKRPFASYRPIGPIYDFEFNTTNNTRESIDEFFRNTAIFKAGILASEYAEEKMQIDAYLPSVEKENVNSLQDGTIRVAAISRYFKNGYKKFNGRTGYKGRQIHIPSKLFAGEEIDPENLDGAPSVFIVRADGSDIPERFTTRYGLYFMKSTLIYKSELIKTGKRFDEGEYRIEVPQKQLQNTPDSIQDTVYDVTVLGLEESSLRGLYSQVVSFTSKPAVTSAKDIVYFKPPIDTAEGNPSLYPGQVVQVIAEPAQEFINL